jgi:hypothetical protein
MLEEDEDQTKEEDVPPKRNFSMKGFQQGKEVTRCSRCGHTFSSNQGYRQHVPNCLG